MPALSVPLRFITRDLPDRTAEPVTVGLPWPRGVVSDDRHFHLLTPDGAAVPLQTEVLNRWPDGSVRWCLFDFLAALGNSSDDYRVEMRDEARTEVPTAVTNPPLPWRLHLEMTDGTSEVFDTPAEKPSDPPVRRRTPFRFVSTGGLTLHGFVDHFPAAGVRRVQLTVTNPQPADHPGGNWDLGNGGSLSLKSLSVRVGVADPSDAKLSTTQGDPFARVARGDVDQHSSGGENWRSANHLTRHHDVPLRFDGARVSRDGAPPTIVPRCTPAALVHGDQSSLGVTMPHFWENFPKRLAVEAGTITLDLFPGDLEREHELQGGEQKTHAFYVAEGSAELVERTLNQCRAPLVCHADPEWYARCEAVPYLTPKASDPNADYLALVDQAIDGPDTFIAKREVIDEYGWRNFGDVYADHEATRHTGPEPLVSHYNNQYDCVGGFAYQFLRSGDPRWFDQMTACADHTCDVDVYHTDGDRAAYNRGLFWHTYHYAAADTGTHRAYPKALRTGPQDTRVQKLDAVGGDTAKKLLASYQLGGGPASSHNYATGLTLAYFLTGIPLYRDTAVHLAELVVRMEDPTTTVFRWLSRERTGYATDSGGGGYHGPGRASGNSVNVLLDGFRLNGDRKFLDFAEVLVRRVVHPKQDLAKLDLLNAELRWFYTMFLQALGRYLDEKVELGELDRMYAYARLALLHYARWMAEYEQPILGAADRLQYPTETWAAQDMRKCEVFQFAAKHATGAERDRFLERAEWFFRYSVSALHGFATKSLCRPVVLMMNFGWSRAWWQANADRAIAPSPRAPTTADDFGSWAMFVPQKARAMKRAKLLAAAGAALLAVIAIAGVTWLWWPK